jgi:hypothetical protein
VFVSRSREPACAPALLSNSVATPRWVSVNLCICLVVIFVFVASAVAMAQTGGGATLVGVVTDGTGALVPSAKLVVINTGTSFRSETVTSAEGSYYVPYLSPGTYQIMVEAPGFKRYVRDGVVIRAGETPRLDITLEIGALAEQVNVTGAAPLLSTETAVASQIIENTTLTSLPLLQRRLLKMLYYFPSVTSSEGYHMVGQRTRAMSYALDGMGAKTPGTGEMSEVDGALSATQDAVEEVKVTTTGMSAEIGHSAGGIQSVVFKSGTNSLHGSFEDRYVNQKMLHRSYLEELRSTAPFRYHEADSSASGPVILPKIYNGKNRTFWLFGSAFHIEQSTYSVRTTVPSDAMYNGDFSFGGMGLPIYNPFSTRQTSSGTWTRDPFSQNRISKDLFDPAVQKFLAQNPWTKPTDEGIMTKTGPQQNLSGISNKHIRRTRWDVKIDHQFTANHKIFTRYSQARHRADIGQTNLELNWALIDPNRQMGPVDQLNLVFSDTLVLGPQRFNEARLGFNRRSARVRAYTYGQDWAKQLGIPNVSPLTFPYFNNVGYALGQLTQSQQIGEDITFQDNFTQILGPHTVKAGYELIRSRFNAGSTQLPSGSYAFGGTDLPFTPNTGNTFASFLVGTVTSAVFTQQFATWLPRWWSHAWFVQDDWKVRRSLTLSLGFRWSYESPFQTKYGQQAQFDPATVDPLTGKMGAIIHPAGPLAARDLNNYQPRLGLAWNFRSRWVFRSSFGVMTQDLKTNGANQNFQEYNGTVNVQAIPGDPRHVFRLAEGPPAFSYPLQPNGTIPFVGTNYSGRNADWIDPNIRMPYTINWSAGIQHEFSNGWLAEVIYQALAGVRLLNNWNINAIPLDVSRDPAVLNQIYQATQNYKPYPQFGNILHYSNYGHNTHHSGTVRLEGKYTAGLTLLTFYTYAKTLDESDDDGTASGISYYNRSLEKGRASYDIRHHFVTVLTYELPVGKGRRWLNGGGVTEHLLGGWNLALNQTFESGPPASVTFSGSPYKYLPGTSRPNALTPIEQAVVQNWSIGPHRFPTSAQNPYLLFANFAYPAAFTAGTLGRNIFEAPGMSWTQVSVSKRWVFRERARVTLRVDGNNLPFKQPQFSRPNSVYNANSPNLFGTFTSTRGSWSGVGSSRSTIHIGIRVEF